MTPMVSSAKKTVTGDESMGIENVIDGMDGVPSHAFVRRISPCKLKKIRLDFLKVARAEKEGACVPNFSALARFVKDEYNENINRNVVRGLMNDARGLIDG